MDETLNLLIAIARSYFAVTLRKAICIFLLAANMHTVVCMIPTVHSMHCRTLMYTFWTDHKLGIG